MTNIADQSVKSNTTGLALHSAAWYDLKLFLFTLGRERAFREKLVNLARLKCGENILDVGCGTGSLAIAAKRQVGPTGTVYGIDASPNMIARADKKARKGGVEVIFQNGLVQALPFPDTQFDVVLSTVMLHHLPCKAREDCVREIRRVLKPNGRVLIVDFGESSQHSFLTHFHRHGFVKRDEIITILSKADFKIIDSGAVAIRDLHFVLASPSGA